MESRLDEKDMRILDVLKNHAEYATRKISKKTLLPPTTINNRIRKLRNDNIIRKYTIIPDHKALGKGFAAYILITVDMHALKEERKSQYDMVKRLRKLDHVERADIVSGGTDIIAFIRARDVQEFDEVLLNRIHAVPGIKNTQSLIVIHPDD